MIEKYVVAVHESGHAVMAYVLHRAVRRVTIVPDEGSAGSCFYFGPRTFDLLRAARDFTKERRTLETAIMTALAGPIAHARIDNSSASAGAEGDRADAAALAAVLVSGGDNEEGLEEATAYLTWLEIRARRILSNPLWWSAVESLATVLVERETVSGRDARTTIQATVDRQMKGCG